MNIDEYGYLWDGKSAGWVLLKTTDSDSGEPAYMPANIIKKNALIIEDDATFSAVIARMLKHGCRIVTPEEWNRKQLDPG